MKKKISIIILSVVAFLGLSYIGITIWAYKTGHYSTCCSASITIGGQHIFAKVADTPAERERGLSGLTEIPSQGMLFVFDKPDIYSFWMKDMLFPIDMIWISEDGKVVYIERDARPESYPNSFIPDAPAKYVLEVNAGFSEKNNLKVGDKVEINL